MKAVVVAAAEPSASAAGAKKFWSHVQSSSRPSTP
jgi:hypothetical protein